MEDNGGSTGPKKRRRKKLRGGTASSRKGTSPKRGRPPGVRLTHELIEEICALIRRGIFPHVAAEGLGVPARTFRDWVLRGQGRHHTRAPTPETMALAEGVRRATAEARMLAESWMHTERTDRWLARAAPTNEDGEGWSDAPTAKDGGLGQVGRFTLEEWDRAMDRLEEAMVDAGLWSSPRCANRRCRCEFHARRKQWHGRRPPK